MIKPTHRATRQTTYRAIEKAADQTIDEHTYWIAFSSTRLVRSPIIALAITQAVERAGGDLNATTG